MGRDPRPDPRVRPVRAGPQPELCGLAGLHDRGGVPGRAPAADPARGRRTGRLRRAAVVAGRPPGAQLREPGPRRARSGWPRPSTTSVPAPALPSPLPDPPPPPLSYVTDLGRELARPSLSPDEQIALVSRLKLGFGTDPDGARELLRRLRDRPDLTWAVAKEIDAVLEAPAAPEPPPVTGPLPGPPAPKRVFLCYRREDTKYIVGRLRDSLSERAGSGEHLLRRGLAPARARLRGRDLAVDAHHGPGDRADGDRGGGWRPAGRGRRPGPPRDRGRDGHGAPRRAGDAGGHHHARGGRAARGPASFRRRHGQAIRADLYSIRTSRH